jgi:hypothetical protein
MDEPAVTTKQLVEFAKKRIEDQQRRIAHQRELIAQYEQDADVGRLSGARLVLECMKKQLAQMRPKQRPKRVGLSSPRMSQVWKRQRGLSPQGDYIIWRLNSGR